MGRDDQRRWWSQLEGALLTRTSAQGGCGRDSSALHADRVARDQPDERHAAAIDDKFITSEWTSGTYASRRSNAAWRFAALLYTFDECD